MILLVTKHGATGEIDESLWESDYHRNARLQLLLMRLQGECAVTEHDTARLDVANAVHLRVDFKLANAFVSRLLRVLWLVRCVLLELSWQTHTGVRDNHIFENDVVISLQLDADHGLLIAHDVHLLLDVSFLNNNASLCDWLATGVDALDEVDGREWLNTSQGFLKGAIRTVDGID